MNRAAEPPLSKYTPSRRSTCAYPNTAAPAHTTPKHEREGLSGISTNSDSKRSSGHPNSWAGREEHRIEREDKREREQEQERLERLGDTDSTSNAAAAAPAESAGGP